MRVVIAKMSPVGLKRKVRLLKVLDSQVITCKKEEEKVFKKELFSMLSQKRPLEKNDYSEKYMKEREKK